MMKPKRGKAKVAFAVVSLMAIALFAVVLSSCGTKSSQRSERVAARTVFVFKTASEPLPSQPGSDLRTRLVSGRVPARETTATVRTDEDCAPDGQGISHCLNRLKLADGSQIAVRHPHDMHEIPCLAPGERVNVRPA
jgi:hypothetical protein